MSTLLKKNFAHSSYPFRQYCPLQHTSPRIVSGLECHPALDRPVESLRFLTFVKFPHLLISVTTILADVLSFSRLEQNQDQNLSTKLWSKETL